MANESSALTSEHLGPSVAQQYQARLEAAINPVEVMEELLIKVVARRAQLLETCDRATSAQLHDAQSKLRAVIGPAAGGEPTNDLLLAQVLASDTMESLSRTSLAHTRAMTRGIHELLALRAARSAEAAVMMARPDPRFATEPACYAYLVRRRRQGEACCRKCGQPCVGKWIARNHSWQCDGCGAQTGIRCNSVMANSALPLCSWFHAIKLQLLRPSISIVEMSNLLAIRRRPTVVAMRTRIRQALASNEATQLLVGLDQAYLPCGS